MLSLRGLVASHDGVFVLRAASQGISAQAETIGIRVAYELLQQGADKILRDFKV